MATSSKVRKDGDDSVEGFIFDISARKQSKNSSPYFTAVIQSGRQEYHRLVIFAMDKRATFSQAEKNGNAVRLKNIRRSISFSDPGGFDVVCSSGTNVEVTNLPFLRCAPPSCKSMTIAGVKALGPKQTVGEVRAKVRRKTSASKVVTTQNCSYDLREVRIFDGTGEIKLTLWDRFVEAAEGSMSYSFKNLSTRERDGCICLCTGPSSTIEAIADLEVAEEEEGGEEEASTVLSSATIKGIEVVIHWRCSSCHCKQKNSIERSATHRCEGCRLKQASLSFCATFGGKAAVLSRDKSVENVLLTSSALSTYLRASGLENLFNNAEAIEDHFLESPAFDIKANLDGFLVSIRPTETKTDVGPSEAAGPSSVSEDWDDDGMVEALLPDGEALPADLFE